MGYLGLRPERFGQYRLLDDISGDFDGVEDTFNLTFNNGTPIDVVDTLSIQIFLNGLILQPIVDYTIVNDEIIFEEPPEISDTFWGLILGGQYDTLNIDLKTASIDTLLYKDLVQPTEPTSVIEGVTPAFTDFSSKLSTTEWVHKRKRATFRYTNNTNTTFVHNITSILPFNNGNLVYSSGLSGLNWVTNELTLPSDYYGLWLIRLTHKPTSLAAIYDLHDSLLMQAWNGSTWTTVNPEHDIHSIRAVTNFCRDVFFPMYYGTPMSKLRVSYRQANTAAANINYNLRSITGIYLGT